MQSKIMNSAIIVLDTETADIDGNICQLAYVSVRYSDSNREHYDYSGCRFSSLYNPIESISPSASAVHHILDVDVCQCAPHTCIEIPESVDYIVGHNVEYDLNALSRSGVNIEDYLNNYIDTMHLAKEVWPNAKSHKLASLVYEFGGSDKSKLRSVYNMSNSHDAMVDVQMSLYLLNLICAELVKQGQPVDPDSLVKLTKEARIPKVMPFGKHKGELIVDLPKSYLSWAYSNLDAVGGLRIAIERAYMSKR